MQNQQTRRIQLGLHVGKHVGDALVLGNRFAELHALAGVEQSGLEGRTGDAQRLRSDADASAFEVRQRNRQALATLAKQVGLRDSAVAERDRAGVRGTDAHLVFAALHRKTRGVGGHQIRGKTLLAEVRISHRENDGQLRPLGIAAELLAAVEHPLAIHQFGACA